LPWASIAHGGSGAKRGWDCRANAHAAALLEPSAPSPAPSRRARHAAGLVPDGDWERIRAATDRLSILPPIEVVKTAEGYWVVDGHNRVAAARATGQVAIDAVVRSVRLPGEPSVRPTGSLAPLLEGSGELRAAASGRFSPGAGLDTVVDDHEHEPPSGDPEPPATGSEAPESDT